MADSVRAQLETSPPRVSEACQEEGGASDRRPGAPQQGTGGSFDRNGQERGTDTPVPPPKPRRLFTPQDTASAPAPELLVGDGSGTDRHGDCRVVPSPQAGDSDGSGDGFTCRTSHPSDGEERLEVEGVSPAAGVARDEMPKTLPTRSSCDSADASDGSGLRNGRERDGDCGGDGDGRDDGGGGSAAAPAHSKEQVKSLLTGCSERNSGLGQTRQRAPVPKPAAARRQQTREIHDQEDGKDESKVLEDLHARIKELEILAGSEAGHRFEAECRAEALEAELRDLADRCEQDFAARAVAESNLARYMKLFREARAAWEDTQGMVEKKERELAEADVKIDGEAGDSDSLRRRLDDAKKSKELCRQQSLALKLALEASPIRDASPDAFSPSRQCVRFYEEALGRDGDGGSASVYIGGKGEAKVAGGMTGGSVQSMDESDPGEEGRRAAAEARWEAGIAARAAVATETAEWTTAGSLQHQRARLYHVEETGMQQQQQQQERAQELQQQMQQGHGASPQGRNRARLSPLGRVKTTAASNCTTQLSPSAPAFFPPSMTAAALKRQQQQEDSSHAVLCSAFKNITLVSGTGEGGGGDGGNNKGNSESNNKPEAPGNPIFEAPGAVTAHTGGPVKGRSVVESDRGEQPVGADFSRFASARGGAGETGVREEAGGVFRRAMALLGALRRPVGEETVATLDVGKGSAFATESIMSGDAFLELHKTQEGVGELLTALGATGLAC